MEFEKKSKKFSLCVTLVLSAPRFNFKFAPGVFWAGCSKVNKEVQYARSPEDAQGILHSCTFLKCFLHLFSYFESKCNVLNIDFSKSI